MLFDIAFLSVHLVQATGFPSAFPYQAGYLTASLCVAAQRLRYICYRCPVMQYIKRKADIVSSKIDLMTAVKIYTERLVLA